MILCTYFHQLKKYYKYIIRPEEPFPQQQPRPNIPQNPFPDGNLDQTLIGNPYTNSARSAVKPSPYE